MTDYLEVLLEEQREEERREPWAWRWTSGALLPPPDDAETEGNRTALETERVVQPSKPGAGAHEEQEPAWETRSWLAGTAEFRQAGARAPEEDESFPRVGDRGALWADRAVRYSLALRTGAEATPPRSGEWYQQGPPAVPELEAERLDRLFRRDARRFDGGFQLL